MDEPDEEEKEEDDGKEPWTIGEREMVNTSADYVDTIEDDQPIILPEQGEEMCEYTPPIHPLAPTPWRTTLDPRP